MQNNFIQNFTFQKFPISVVLSTGKRACWMCLFCLALSAYSYDTNRSFQAGQVPQELKGIRIDGKTWRSN